METKDIEGKKVKLVAPEPPQTSIDTDNNLEQTILTSALRGDLRTDVFESFTTVAQTRENMYELIDTMGMDSTIAAAIETYAEDITQPNPKGEIFWVESQDADVARYINYLLRKLEVDKQAFSLAYNLVKYGDVYVRLLRESDFNNSRLFNNKKNKEKPLKEDVNINISKPNDHYSLNFELVRNPGEMFELTKFGKTMGYIQAGVDVQKDFTNNNEVSYYTKYRMARKDVDIYPATDFVHACLESSTSRADEEIDIFFNDEDYDTKANAETFQVRRGTGILNDLFKVWRQLSLLENSILLNRLTRSSIVRAIQMEVGDMPNNQVMNVTNRVKNLIEQKSALEAGKRMSEYTNPGPIENVIILPTRNGKGGLSIQQIGGDVDPKQLTDLDWFNNKLFGGLKIPKQYFGWTDDAAGFSGGTSLSQYSARYGKTVKRIQKSLCQMITDMINLILVDKQQLNYINNFQIKMQPPVTQEEIDRKQDLSNTLRNVSDIMNTLGDIESPVSRLKILKSLLAECVSEQDVITTIQDEIDRLENEANNEENEGEGNEGNENSSEVSMEDTDNSFNDLLSSSPSSSGFENEGTSTEEAGTGEVGTEETGMETEAGMETNASEELPTFADLGIDGTVNQ